MSWERRPLAEVADFCLGKMLDQRKNRGDFMPYLANVNVRWGEFELSDLREMRFGSHELDRYGLKYGDIVMCEGGEPGRCAIWKEQTPGMMFQKALHRIRPNEGLRSDFLYYQFLKMGRRNEFAGLFTGSTIKHLPREKLAKVEVEIPPAETQERIASILSAYDDLIENNRRRITLLEEAARQLYKEWFVRFRFPGHEHVAIVDGVPTGWKHLPISEIWSIRYGTNLPTTQVQETGRYPVHGANDIIGFYGTKNVDGPRCLVTCRGNGSGNVRRTFGEAFVTNNSFVLFDKLDAENIRFHFAIFAMESLQLQKMRTGAAQPQLTIANISHVPILVAPEKLLIQYNETADLCFEQADTLRRQNSNLERARDLLLPKLMSGEIAV